MSAETPKMGHAPIEMRFTVGKVERVGDFYYDIICDADGNSTTKHIWIATPLSADLSDFVVNRWAIRPHTLQNGASWEWDGDIYAPTLSPSLHHVGVWHGRVEKGVLREVWRLD